MQRTIRASLIVISSIISNTLSAEEKALVPNEIEAKYVNGSDESWFTYWPHAAGVIGNEKVFVVSAITPISDPTIVDNACVFALYKLKDEKYHLSAISSEHGCPESIEFRLKSNLLEITIFRSGSKSYYNSTYKFSKEANEYVLVGIDGRSMHSNYDNSGSFNKDRISLNLLTSKATLSKNRYCANGTNYQRPCSTSKKSRSITLRKKYQFSNFDYDDLENEISEIFE